MHLLLRLLLAVITIATASPVHTKRGAPDYSITGDAPFSVDANTLAAAITCPNGNPTSAAPPVLLIHGTGSTGAETWGEGYVPALQANGYTACYVTLPGRAMGDMQISSEYVAYGLHYISSISGGLKTAVISHSQGGPVTQWALQFWPSTRSVTRAFIPLSPDFAGIDILSSNLSSICEGIKCQASIWQQREGSKLLEALHAHDFGALVPTTSIWTQVSHSSQARSEGLGIDTITSSTAWSRLPTIMPSSLQPKLSRCSSCVLCVLPTTSR